MRFFLLNILLLLTCATQAQVSMRDVLKSMPDTIVPYLTENNRLDCIDFKEAKMKAEVQNALGGKSELVTLTDQLAVLQLNAAHRMELRLLDVSLPIDSCQQLIGVVHTYGSEVKQSRIQFFSLRWRELPTADYISLPQEMFTATFDQQRPELNMTFSNYLDSPAMEEQKPLEKSSTNLKWSNNFFK